MINFPHGTFPRRPRQLLLQLLGNVPALKCPCSDIHDIQALGYPSLYSGGSGTIEDAPSLYSARPTSTRAAWTIALAFPRAVRYEQTRGKVLSCLLSVLPNLWFLREQVCVGLRPKQPLTAPPATGTIVVIVG
jgi:hypothetical protein